MRLIPPSPGPPGCPGGQTARRPSQPSKKGGPLCLPGAHLPSSPKTPPDLSSQTSQRMWWGREKLLWWRVLCSGSVPPHMLTSHFPDTASPAGESGMKDTVPDSGSSQDTLGRRANDISEEVHGDMPYWGAGGPIFNN